MSEVSGLPTSLEGRVIRLEVTVEQHGKQFDVIEAHIKDETIPAWRFKLIERIVLLALGGAGALLGMFIKATLGF